MRLKCFVILPFTEEYSGIYEKIRESVKLFNSSQESQDQKILVTRADQTPIRSMNSLEEHLKDNINNSDFVITEISDLNPNVMFEMGYAVSQSNPKYKLSYDVEECKSDIE